MKLYTEETLRQAYIDGQTAGHPLNHPKINLDDYEAVEAPVMPEKLTAENGAKALLMGEFFEITEIDNENYCGCNNCDFCEMFPDEKPEVEKKVPVSWSTIKDIYRTIHEHFNKNE